MSRIQDILAKAERDGTAGRLHATAAAAPAPEAAPALPVDGTSALDPAFIPAIAGVAAARSVVPTLHPALVAAIAPHSTVAEEYRAIRSRLGQREDAMPLRSLVITSPAAGDGKSLTAANLALTMAQEFQRNVLLVDTDLRDPSVHDLFGVDATPGLADVLAGTASLDEALTYLPDVQMTLLPAGHPPPFPAELLGSAAMRHLIDMLRNRFDRLVFDAPTAAPLADTRTLAPLVDGVLMVVRAGATQRPALDEALTVFDPRQIVGIVLNDTK
jgi:protein-tyrosine kinase